MTAEGSLQNQAPGRDHGEQGKGEGMPSLGLQQRRKDDKENGSGKPSGLSQAMPKTSS